MKFHGIEVEPKPGESPARAWERTIKEQHARLQQAIADGTKPLYAKAPTTDTTPKVVGLDYTPTLMVKR